jgi:phage FluMu protein Com
MRTRKRWKTGTVKSRAEEDQADTAAFDKQIQQMEKESLRYKPHARKRQSSEIIAYTMLVSGTVALVTSILYSSSTLAFSGLGLTFWGGLLLFIKPTKHVKASLLTPTVLSSLRTVNQIITEINFEGEPTYLPPKYLKTPKSSKVFISSKRTFTIPSAEEVAKGNFLLANQQGILLIPPGLDLANFYEKKLKKDFVKADLNYLKNNLPKLFVEDLELAEDLEINIEGNTVHAKIRESIYKDLCNKMGAIAKTYISIGCPLCSSIAIALTRATGKPIIIKKSELTEDDKGTEVYYQIIEDFSLSDKNT